MDFKAALEAIKKLENGADLASAIEAETDFLKSKNYEVIGEKRNATSKAQAYESALTEIGKALGIEGDAEAILKDAEGKVRGIVAEATQLKTDKTALETRATEAEGKVQKAERASKLATIAAAAGANASVLERLLGDKIDEMKVDGEGDQKTVKLGDKSLKDAIAADETLKPFEAALFPTQQTTTTQTRQATAKLPGGSPNGGNGKKDLLTSYADRTYGGAKALLKKAEQAED